MARLVPLTPGQIKRRFRELGYTIVQGGDHEYAVKGVKKIKLPNDHGSVVSVGLLSRMLRDAGIDRHAWLS